jgi:hypothetical protein
VLAYINAFLELFSFIEIRNPAMPFMNTPAIEDEEGKVSAITRMLTDAGDSSGGGTSARAAKPAAGPLEFH